MIDNFSGKYYFLSNFFKEKDGLTLEHRFQAAKTEDPYEAEAILYVSKPSGAKRLGRVCKLRSDWESVKQDVMLTLLRNKFSDKQLKELLLATGEQELVEGNTWHDYYWGVCNGKGQNWLGKSLMKIREELKENNEV